MSKINSPDQEFLPQDHSQPPSLLPPSQLLDPYPFSQFQDPGHADDNRISSTAIHRDSAPTDHQSLLIKHGFYHQTHSDLLPVASIESIPYTLWGSSELPSTTPLTGNHSPTFRQQNEIPQPLSVDQLPGVPPCEPGTTPMAANTHKITTSTSNVAHVEVQAHVDRVIEAYNNIRDLISPSGSRDETEKHVLYGLRGADAQCMVDLLNKLLVKELVLDSSERRHALRLLCKVAKSAQVYPRSCELAGVQCSLTRPMNEGGFGCIYKGTFKNRAVCVKAVRIYARKDNRRTLRAHAGELALWAHIAHHNILPFYGVFVSDEAVERICIVSPWMDHGDLLQYLNAFPDSPRIPLISDIISGLVYLHGMNIIHADLKASNVLISNDKRAMLADFGISHISMTLVTTTARSLAGTANWTAPELLLEEDNEPLATKKSDIWSFACTCYEVLTGEMPFYHIKKVVHLIRALMRGVRPIRTTLVNDRDPLEEHMWTIMEMCWNHDPEKRPDAEEVKRSIWELSYVDNRPALDSCTAPGHSSPWEEVNLSRSDIAIDYKRILSIFHQIEQLDGGVTTGKGVAGAPFDLASLNAKVAERLWP